jgi:hypothetical protein
MFNSNRSWPCWLAVLGSTVSVCGLRRFTNPCLVQRLAVDVSIWLTRFIKAMRDEDGRMRTNAHILGVLRRLCKVRRVVLFP